MSNGKQAPRVLCIWLPNWPVQRVQAAEPKLAKLPLALTVRDARRGIVVTAANLLARQQGVHPQMRLSEAKALVDELVVVEQDVDEDIDGLAELSEGAQRFSPIVGFEQLDRKLWAGRTRLQPEALLLDVTSIGRLFGSEQKLCDEIGDWLSSQRYFGCIAIADCVGAAWAAANYCTRRAESKAIHTEAARSGNADSERKSDSEAEEDDPQNLNEIPASRSYIINEGENISTVGELPLAALRIEYDTISSLHRLGIRKVSELDKLPRDGVASRLGEQLLTRRDQASGQATEPIISSTALPHWCFEKTLEHPTQDRRAMEQLLQTLTKELAGRLEKRGEGAIRILCRMELIESPPLLMQLGLFRPTSDGEHLASLLCGQLEQLLLRLSPQPLWRISLQATLTAPLNWRQGDLFDSEAANKRQEVARLVDVLSSRLGRKQVLQARTHREAQPELAFSLTPITGKRRDGKEADTVKKLSSRLAKRRAEPSAGDPLRRPCQLFSPPKRIEAAGKFVPPDDVETLAAPPARIKYQGGWHEIVDAQGPERLESGWWRGPSQRRDYFRIATHHGSWWWIYRDLNEKQWYLHGCFD